MGRAQGTGQRVARALRGLVALGASLLLAGCLLMSGEATTIDLQAGGGNVLTTFVSAEGAEERTLEIGTPGAEVQVIAVVEVESGDLELSLLEPDGELAFGLTARPATQVTRSGAVSADAEGRVRYRVRAQGARDGSFQLFVQP
jgi:molybdopterin-binding protein